MDIQASTSEDNGVTRLQKNDLQVYSVGISTGGIAEIRMAEMSAMRHIVATTIDEAGAAFAAKRIKEASLDDRIEVKIEDVAEPLPYEDATFDYIYARLVLHYLPKDKLVASLAELWRVLKPHGKLFVVVRSTSCPDAIREGAYLDPVTHLTTCTYNDEKTGKPYTYSRYFHTEGSIHDYVVGAGFQVAYVKAYAEHLFVDFMRTERSPSADNVIELFAEK